MRSIISFRSCRDKSYRRMLGELSMNEMPAILYFVLRKKCFCFQMCFVSRSYIIFFYRQLIRELRGTCASITTLRCCFLTCVFWILQRNEKWRRMRERKKKKHRESERKWRNRKKEDEGRKCEEKNVKIGKERKIKKESRWMQLKTFFFFFLFFFCKLKLKLKLKRGRSLLNDMRGDCYEDYHCQRKIEHFSFIFGLTTFLSLH